MKQFMSITLSNRAIRTRSATRRPRPTRSAGSRIKSSNRPAQAAPWCLVKAARLAIWKTHPEAWGPTGFSTSQLVSSVFSSAGIGVYQQFGLGNSTLLQALNFQGGSTLKGAAEILLRAAVSAVLNAADPSVNYPLTVAQIQSAVNSALDSLNRSTILALATTLDADNNLGCPLN